MSSIGLYRGFRADATPTKPICATEPICFSACSASWATIGPRSLANSSTFPSSSSNRSLLESLVPIRQSSGVDLRDGPLHLCLEPTRG